MIHVNPEQIRKAWEQAEAVDDLYTRGLLPAEKVDYGRRATAVHVPTALAHGTFCHSCGHPYPCWVAKRAMGMLKVQGWHVSDVIDLIESVQAGGGNP